MLGTPGVPARPADPGATTVLSSPGVPEPDATVLSTPRPADADQTVASPPGSPGESDATVLSSPGKSLEHDPTVLASRPHVEHDATRLTPAGSRPAQPRGGPEGPLTVGDTFGRYSIMKLLGAGGMGAVYQAWDTELEVVVALKVIRPEVLRDPAAAEEIERRFKRELLLARQVTHKNVVRIYDLGEIDGIKYITMSYVDGKELGQLLKEGQLPIPSDPAHHAVRRLRTRGGAQSRRHPPRPEAGEHHDRQRWRSADHGLRHRAFGSRRRRCRPLPARPCVPAGLAQAPAALTARHRARARSSAPSSTWRRSRRAARLSITARTSLRSGSILYDMLAGTRRPGHDLSIIEQLNARIAGHVAPLKSVAPHVPDALAAVVTRAIETDPANRYQTTDELVAALDALDDNGIPKPVKRVVRSAGGDRRGGPARWRTCGALVWVSDSRRPRYRVTRRSVYRGFREPHRRGRLRPDARAQLATRAGRRRIHHGLRPRRPVAHRRRQTHRSACDSR